MDDLDGVKTIYSRLVHAKVLIVDDDFKDTDDKFISQCQADIVITKDGVVVKSKLTRLPINVDPDEYEHDGHLYRLKNALIKMLPGIRRIELE